MRYDSSSNTGKNLALFQFFSEDLKINKKDFHKAFKYDFEDYNGEKDYTKMFVTKLLQTGKGQCHSLPLLYLILAEEIGAESFLVIAPNHSYIRFYDDQNKLQSIELTSGMFSNDAFILESGYVKTEALNSEIFMKNLTKKELKSQMISDLILQYIHQFDYDELVNQMNQEALRINPKNVSSQMIKANFNTIKFEYVMKQLNINPRNANDLQNVRFYPRAVNLLNETNKQYEKIDELGFAQMPEEHYKNWLKSLNNEKSRRESKETFKAIKNEQLPKNIKLNQPQNNIKN